KPHQCDVCKKCFTQISRPTFNEHIKVHTGEKPYQCDVCKMCFAEANYLNAHI
ncbi:hypothetical protein LOTGIDRAFT_114745, partial [Lottia gigantea]